jgi:hypothetical protein
VSLLAAAIPACTAQYHARDVQGASERTMTLGVVQKEIHRGLSQADVAEALGSPNIVTRDSAELETWVYDKTATEASYSVLGCGLQATPPGGPQLIPALACGLLLK